MSSPPIRPQHVSATIIRRLFNSSQYPEQVKEGTLVPDIIHNDHIKHPKPFQGPYCTRSQIVRYLDSKGRWVVEIHQYLRPVRTLGASGQPDPKRLRIGNDIYIYKKRRKQQSR